jgi:hypothetical protein
LVVLAVAELWLQSAGRAQESVQALHVPFRTQVFRES